MRLSILATLMGLSGAALGQFATNAPDGWGQGCLLSIGSSLIRTSQNRPEDIRRELSDTNLIQFFARVGGLSPSDLESIRIVPVGTELGLFRPEVARQACIALGLRMDFYIKAREDGHTRAFVMSWMTNAVRPLSVSDPDLRTIALNRPQLPIAWMKKTGAGTETNKAGQIALIARTVTVTDRQLQASSTTNVPTVSQIRRWVSYTVVDGEIEWVYVARFKPGGGLYYVEETRRDSKDSNPQHRQAIGEVEQEVEAEMTKRGVAGRFGSTHVFWRLKKEKLKTRGIDWYSPAELNPNVRYD